MENKNLAAFMSEYGKAKKELSSISASIASKERKIAVLKEEYHNKAIATQKLGFKKITVGYQDVKEAIHKNYFKSRDCKISIKWPTSYAPKYGKLTKAEILFNMKNNQWIEIVAATKYKNEKFYLPFEFDSKLSNGRTVEDCIVIKRIPQYGDDIYQISVDENLLLFTFSFDDCVKFDRETLMFAKTLGGAVLRLLIEKEQTTENEKEGEIE